jgi:hypothetical protein
MAAKETTHQAPVPSSETTAERRARRADAKKQEQAPAERKVGRVARDFVHTKHAETGQAVVFLPGELLPEWVELTAADEAW